jgi:hypothetical protein
MTCEKIAEYYSNNVKYVGLRVFAGYGPGEEHKRDYASPVTLFLNAIMNDRPPIVFGDGSRSRDFVYIDDIVNAFLKARAACLLPRGVAMWRLPRSRGHVAAAALRTGATSHRLERWEAGEGRRGADHKSGGWSEGPLARMTLGIADKLCQWLKPSLKDVALSAGRPPPRGPRAAEAGGTARPRSG